MVGENVQRNGRKNKKTSYSQEAPMAGDEISHLALLLELDTFKFPALLLD